MKTMLLISTRVSVETALLNQERRATAVVKKDAQRTHAVTLQHASFRAALRAIQRQTPAVQTNARSRPVAKSAERAQVLVTPRRRAMENRADVPKTSEMTLAATTTATEAVPEAVVAEEAGSTRTEPW